jgi:hypothetical protein
LGCSTHYERTLAGGHCGDEAWIGRAGSGGGIEHGGDSHPGGRGRAGRDPHPGYAEPAPVDPELVTAFTEADRADVWIRFEARADLSQARALTDWTARGEAVVDRLRETARTSQAEVIETLDAAGQSYQAFYITNAVYVRDGSPALAAELATHAAVSGIHQPTGYEPPETPGEGGRTDPPVGRMGDREHPGRPGVGPVRYPGSS